MPISLEKGNLFLGEWLCYASAKRRESKPALRSLFSGKPSSAGDEGAEEGSEGKCRQGLEAPSLVCLKDHLPSGRKNGRGLYF
jgi:hypothetical protein